MTGYRNILVAVTPLAERSTPWNARRCSLCAITRG
jgi:hypothetical protein